MSRRWFSRKGLTAEAEEFDIVVHDMTKGRLNGCRLLTACELPFDSSLTMGPFGSTPNSSGGTIATNQLFLQPASTSFGGGVSTTTQSFAGNKTFTGDVSTQRTFRLVATTDADHGVLYMGSNPYIHSYADISNTFLGINSCMGNTPIPLGENTGIGNNCLTNIIDPAQGNTALGSGCLPFLETGVGNTGVGWANLSGCIGGSYNTGLGTDALGNCIEGSRNIAIGYNAGLGVANNDDTINIGATGSTTSGEINIGTSGTHTKATFAGIASVSPGGTPQNVIINPATGQLGSQVLPTFISSEARMTTPAPPSVLTSSMQLLAFNPFNGVDPGGITKTDASTYQITRKGNYLCQVQLVMAGASRAAVRFSVDGGVIDTQTSVIPEGVGAIVIAHTFLFPYAFTTDGVHTFTFEGAAEDLPTPDASCNVTLTEISIQHWDTYY